MVLSSSAKRATKFWIVGTAVIWTAYIALRIIVGQCPKPKLVENYDPDAYLGIWYELRRDESIPFETGECVTAQYRLNDDGSIRVTN